MDYRNLSKIADSANEVKSVFKIEDAQIGDPFDNGEVKGKILEIKTAEDGTKTVVVESQNEDGNIENIEVAIEDSKSTELSEEELELVNDYPGKEWFDKICEVLKITPKAAMCLFFCEEAPDFTDSYLEDADAAARKFLGDELANIIDEEYDGAFDEAVLAKLGFDDFKSGRALEIQDLVKEHIEDSADEDFARTILVKGVVEDPYTGKWEVKNAALFNNDVKVLDLPENLGEAKKLILKTKIDTTCKTFAKDLIAKTEVECPETGKWEIKDKELFLNGTSLGMLPETAEEAAEVIEASYKDALGQHAADSQVTDSEDGSVERAAAFAIDENNIYDLFNLGVTRVTIPSGVDTKEFSDAVIEEIKNIWGDPSVGIDYEDKDFITLQDGNILEIKCN